MKSKGNRWAVSFDKCKDCGTTDRPHFSRGQCQPCYFKQYNAENGERVKAYKIKWYRQNITPEFQKAVREQKQFGGLREAALARDNFRCVKCGAARQLVVHHKDGMGRSVPEGRKNNRLSNLQTLCRACHLKEHKRELYNARKAKGYRRRSGLTYKNSTKD